MTARARRPAAWPGALVALLALVLSVVTPTGAHARQVTPTPAAPTAAAAARPDVAAHAGDTLAANGLVVPAGATTGSVVVLRGPVDVYGTVRGDAVSLAGDLTVHPGGRVTGDVVSVFGTARNLSGRVGGDVVSRAGRPWDRTTAGSRAVARPSTVGESLKATVGWFGILLVIGFGVLVAASRNLDGVAETLERGIGRSLLAGLAGQFLLLPALVTLVVALAVTVLGILAIPLAVVAFVAAAAGLGTLGFLAVCFVAGRAMVGGEAARRLRASAARADAVRAMSAGVAVFAALWIAAALLGGMPAVALLVRAATVSLTWVAVTAGLGAGLLSWAGTRGPRRGPDAAVATGAVPTDRSGVPVWQTPTPVAGIVAARRPTPPPVGSLGRD
ncbi:MAG TPA: polymer-forming cytoskeletal protein [Gemmatirosa sp.]|nr:polymer-forming cytoskeletal protein [Gemmatirosa sp.]